MNIPINIKEVAICGHRVATLQSAVGDDLKCVSDTCMNANIEILSSCILEYLQEDDASSEVEVK